MPVCRFYGKSQRDLVFCICNLGDSVLANVNKKRRYTLPITGVTHDEQIMEEIKKITENKGGIC